MKNRIRFFGIAAISAAIGFALALSTAGCDSGGGGGNSQLTGTVSISGTAATGQTLTANTGSLGGSGSISYQWKRGNTNTGSNSSTYTVQEADIGFAITVTVTRPGWSGSVTSSPTAAVTDSSLPPLTGLVSISGNALVGETLTANTSALGGEGSVSYQWKRGAVSVGSDSGTYTLQTADAESAVTVTVTRSGCSGSVTSEPTELVALYGLKGIDGEDFGVRGVITNTFNVGSAAEWGEALSAISGGGNNNNYIINITADFFVTGRSSYNFMGSVSGVKVSLRGEGRTLTLTSGGSMAYAGSEQTVILRGLTLRGLGSNSTSLVYVSGGGAFTMQSGKLTGNTASSTSGVYVGIAGTFTMNGGEISGNTSSGMSGGIISVYQYGAFTMNGGEISGNTTYTGTFGGVRVNGGVVALNEGAFTMSGGEISGNTGCGVIIAANSAFDMYNGEISGNTADGVYIAAANGAFNMHNGEISGNSNGVNVAANGAFNMYNGEISSWVYVAANGTFNMHNGEISSWVYVAASGAFRIANGGVRGLNNSGTSQYGVFSGSTWDSAGAIYTTSHTVKIVNGVPYIGSLLANNYTFDVSDAEGWENAHNAINTYDNYSYTINVTADFDAAGRTDANIIRSGITVTVQGEGRTLGLSSGGSLIRTGSGQTIILKGLTLRGSVNNASLVYVNGGTFTMESGEISGNSNGVYVAANGAFTMESGEISGNTSSGVYVANGGAFRIANGIIYGTNEADTGLRNGVDGEAGAVLLNYGTAQYGVYSGSTWNSAGSVYTTSHTIKVVNGVPYIGSLPANNYTFNTATTADWDNAHNAINTYDNYSYTINVTSDFDAAGRTAANFIRTGIKVTVQGEGKTLAFHPMEA
ncbi:MAG: hypothetical protein LBH43_10040 [Treponema sp.]|nr:hypothetical protein [Treponema sp.]